MPGGEIIAAAGSLFRSYYEENWGEAAVETPSTHEKGPAILTWQAPLLRPSNAPAIWHHGQITDEVIVLCHGLSDSPFYMQAIARRFFEAGFNVVLPLLPAHGLRHPDSAFKEKGLSQQWKACMDHATKVASLLGKRLSLGGFSTGGTLSLNFMLRHSSQAEGALFLFSAALDHPQKAKLDDPEYMKGFRAMAEEEHIQPGRNPYKYPSIPLFGGLALIELIRENDHLLGDQVIPQRVFAAHSLHDARVQAEDISRFLRNHVSQGLAFFISEQLGHSHLVLEQAFSLNEEPADSEETAPQANPRFDWMMQDALRFFRET